MPQRKEIKEQLIHNLGQFLTKQSEENLVNAYELGRSAVEAGLGELELINLYHETLLEINSGGVDEDLNFRLKFALDFLSECLAPFDMRQRAFHDLIQKQRKQNFQLQKEIERRKEVEENLKESKEHFQHLIENALDIITILGYDGTIRFESPSIERILGYTSEELIGENVFEYLHANDIERIQEIFSAITQTPGKTDSAEFRFRHKDGSWVYLQSIAKNVASAKVGPGVIVNSRDVTERIKAWEKLKKNEKQLSTAQQIGRLGSWEWTINENTLNWSDELCRIYGIERDRQPRNYSEYLEFLHPDDREMADKIIRKAFEENSDFRFEHKLIRPDGTLKTLSCRGEVITDLNGKPVKMVGTAQDISEIKKTEQKLRIYSKQLKNLTARQEKVREDERTRIAREIHDELGQMLTVLKMDLSMVIKKGKKEYEEIYKSDFSDEFSRIINRIDTIIHSVQRITAELRPEVLDELGLKEALEWQADEFQKRTGIKLEFTNRASSFNILGEERSTAMFRIFQETLTNIIRHADASRVDVLLEEDDPYLILKVRDDGTGITIEELEHPDSLGIIGMRERSQVLGGSIDFKSTPGQGTTVTLKIPYNGT